MALPLGRDRARFQDDNPARVYLATLSPGSYWAMSHALETIADLLSGGETDAESYPWWELTYRETVAVRNALAERYKPATVNKMLAALRGVLKQAWRLGHLDAETYRRAVDVPNLRARTLTRGRALSREEVRALFEACDRDGSHAGRRDSALLAVLYGGGLRRAEAVGLELEDLNLRERVLAVRQGKGRKDRTVYLTHRTCRLLKAWIKLRGSEPGALFCPVDSSGRVTVRRMRGECLSYILRRRQEQAGVEPFSPHDLRRTFISDLLSAGVDVFTVQALAGHANPGTTARYDHREESLKKQAAQQIRLPNLRTQQA